VNVMDVATEVAGLIGQPEGIKLEYKAVLPPAATVAQLVSSFANTEGGFIVLGASDAHGGFQVNGLSDEFHAVSVTHKAIDLLSPRPLVNYQYVDYRGKRLYVIKVEKSDVPIVFGARTYVRNGSTSALQQEEVVKSIHDPKIRQLTSSLNSQRKTCTAAKAKVIDHYQSVLNILDDLGSLLYPEESAKPTTNPEGKVLMRILFSSCADNFETYLSELLYEIYLAKPETLKSESPITVREVLECSDMQEFISVYAKKKLSKLQRGSVQGFIAENKQISALGVLDKASQQTIERILQIRHLYSHRNGVVDEKFQGYFPNAKLNEEHRMALDELLEKFEYLATTIDAVDTAALAQYQLASFS
jgi:Putative DNA-binding domain